MSQPTKLTFAGAVLPPVVEARLKVTDDSTSTPRWKVVCGRSERVCTYLLGEIDLFRRHVSGSGDEAVTEYLAGVRLEPVVGRDAVSYPHANRAFRAPDGWTDKRYYVLTSRDGFGPYRDRDGQPVPDHFVALKGKRREGQPLRSRRGLRPIPDAVRQLYAKTLATVFTPPLAQDSLVGEIVRLPAIVVCKKCGTPNRVARPA